MHAEVIVYLLQQLGLSQIKVGTTGWVTASCPFKFKHTDSSPSFGIKINKTGRSNYSCLGCHNRGSLHTLIWTLDEATGNKGYFAHLEPIVAQDGIKDPETAKKIIDNAVLYAKPINIGGMSISAKAAKHAGIDKAPEPLEESFLEPFRHMDMRPYSYLTGPKRKLTKETIERWELGWQVKQSRIVIPIRDTDGNLVGISRRLLESGSTIPQYDERGKIVKIPKYLHSKGFRRDFYLYGEHLSRRGGTCHIVEGFFDTQWLDQLGYSNVVAIMGSYPSDIQVKKILNFYDNAKVMGDGDAAGAEMAKAVMARLQGSIPCENCRPLDGKDPNDMMPEEVLAVLGPPQTTKND